MRFFAAIAAVAALKVKSTAHTTASAAAKELMASKRNALVKTDAEQCYDLDAPSERDTAGDGCDYYYGNEWACGLFDDDDFIASWWCCACDGGW